MDKLQAAGLEILGPCPPNLDEKWLDITLPDGWKSRTKVVWQRKPVAGQIAHCSLVVYFHGGGFSAGDPDQVLAPARAFASIFNCVVACPSYKMTPSHIWPAPMHSAWQVCAWLSDVKNLNEGPLSGTGVSINPQLGFVVGGISSGGSLAAVIGGIAGASAVENGRLLNGLSSLGSPITGIFAGTPLLLNEKMVPEPYRREFYSREQNAFNEGMTTPMVRKVEESLKANVESPWFSPVNLDFSNPEIAQHHPRKVFTYSCEFDPLRDDAAIYEKCLSGSSTVETRITMVKEAVHTAWATLDWPDAHTPLIKETTLDGIGWLLGEDWRKDWSKDKELPY